MRTAIRGLALAAGLLMTLVPRPASALDPTRTIVQYVHRSWETEDGLPQNSISAIAQSDEGYLWLGTQAGLVRFDGARFTVFNRLNTPALRSNFIAALHKSPDGAIWIGTDDG